MRLLEGTSVILEGTSVQNPVAKKSTTYPLNQSLVDVLHYWLGAIFWRYPRYATRLGFFTNPKQAKLCFGISHLSRVFQQNLFESKVGDQASGTLPTGAAAAATPANAAVKYRVVNLCRGTGEGVGPTPRIHPGKLT